MRRLGTTLLTAMLLTFGLAGNASAVGIVPEELGFNASGVVGQLFIVSIDRGVLTLQLDVDNGQVAGLNVTLLDSNDDAVIPVGSGVRFGPGVNVHEPAAGSGIAFGDAGFAFDTFQFGIPSDHFFIDYGTRGLTVGDTLSVTLFQAPNQELTTLNANVVPEPASAMLLGMGLGGLAFAGRRRS